MFQVLWPFIDYAIANAERLDKLNERKTPASAVPGTKVHELIKNGMIFTCFSAKWRIIDFMIYFNLAKCKYVLKMKAENLWGEYQNCVKG